MPRVLRQVEGTTREQSKLGARKRFVAVPRQDQSLPQRVDEDVFGVGGGECHGPSLHMAWPMENSRAMETCVEHVDISIVINVFM